MRRTLGSFRRAVLSPIDIPRSRLLTSPARRLPDLLVIGAAKAGTSSMFYALKHHPAVRVPSTKEVSFFDLHFALGVPWYRAHFPRAGGAFTLDATPYYLFHPHAPRRAAGVVPDAKILVLLRNPIDRAYSHYQHHRRDGSEDLSFDEALDREHERIAEPWRRTVEDEWFVSMDLHRFSYLARGRYAEQLERWLSYFPREHLLVERSEDLYADPGSVFRRVTSFLDLPSWEPDVYVHRNAGGYSQEIGSDTRARLRRYFAPYNEQLYDLLGVDLRWR